MSAFLVMLREGVEAALIVAILLAYLNRTGRQESSAPVWWGTGAAIALSLIIGVVIWNTVGELEGDAEEAVEGVIAITATALLTWMIFWMGRQARHLRQSLEEEAGFAVAAGPAALALVAFVAVGREGLESVLFLISTTVGEDAAGGQALGGVLGVAVAAVIGYLVYRGSQLVNLRLFFRISGYLLLLFAAGLVAKAVHEFQELGVLPELVEHLWDVGVLDPSTSTFAAFLATMFGWDPDPSLLQVVGYFAFLIPTGMRFHNMTRLADPLPAVSVEQALQQDPAARE